MNMKKYLIFMVLLLVFFIGQSYQTGSDERLKKIHQQLERFSTNYPQQKVYLHLDKRQYLPNENIWFKAYLNNASTHQADNFTKNLYVELIDENKSVIRSRLLKVEKGVASGDFNLCDTLHEGSYQIRAYTNWMRNFDNKFFFTQEIEIVNPYVERYKSPKRLKKRKLKKKRRKFEIQFFPEGGCLVKNLKSKISFKAVNSLGEGVEIKGRLLTPKGNEILRFNSAHKGMGSFAFTPKSQREYKIEIEFPNGDTKKYKLPEAEKYGWILNLNKIDEKNIYFKIKTNRLPTEDKMENDIILAGQTRGKLYFAEIKEVRDSTTIKISKNIFPSGITQFTLFNGKGEPFCERLLFIDKNEQLNISINPTKKEYDKREKIGLEVLVKDKNGNPIQTSVSLAITKEELVSQKNILEYFLLSSDLKGNIENPNYYFDEKIDKKTRENHLDLLLTTQGWRRFEWKKILDNKYPNILFYNETDIRISGTITKEFFNISSSNSMVRLNVLNDYNYRKEMITGKDGRFLFTDLDYTDTVEILIEARNRRGKKRVVILIDELLPPEVFFNPSIHQKYRKGIFAKRYRPKKEELDYLKLHNKPSSGNVIKAEKYANQYDNVLDLVAAKVPGVTRNGSTGLSMRGFNTHRPMFILDGTEVNMFSVENLPVEDVEQIEVLKGAEASIYGLGTGNGVIAIYTKKGFHIKKGELHFKILGYYKNRSFYTPIYRTKIEKRTKKIDLRRTLFWKPELTTSPMGRAKIYFYTSDNAGNYECSVQTITKEGKIGNQKCKFSVR